MTKAIVFNSISGNTEKLANEIKNKLGEVMYFGKPDDKALEADVIYIGSWTQAFSATADVKDFMSKLNNKKVFVFMTAGYGSTPEFFAPIIASAKESINDSNEIIGEYICQGKVSAGKMAGIKSMDEAKYEKMLPELEKSQSHPDQSDVENIIKLV